MKVKKERNEKRASSYAKTHRLLLYASTRLPLKLITAGQERHSDVRALYTVQDRGLIQMQESSLLMTLAYLQNKSVQHIQASRSPSGKDCQWSLQRGRATAHEYKGVLPLQVNCDSVASSPGLPIDL